MRTNENAATSAMPYLFHYEYVAGPASAAARQARHLIEAVRPFALRMMGGTFKRDPDAIGMKLVGVDAAAADWISRLFGGWHAIADNGIALAAMHIAA